MTLAFRDRLDSYLWHVGDQDIVVYDVGKSLSKARHVPSLALLHHLGDPIA